MSLEHDPIFATVLEECSQRVKKGEDLEGCLRDYPAAYQEELARLVPMTMRFDTLIEDPSPIFQAQLERQLSTAVAESKSVRRTGRPGSIFGGLFSRALALRTAAVMAVTFLVLGGASIGAVQASESSLPDSPLYRIKRAREWAQVTLAPNDEVRVAAYAQQIDTRAQEIEQVVQIQRDDQIETLINRLIETTRQAVDRALRLKEQNNPRAAQRALSALQKVEKQILVLAPQAPQEMRPRLRRLYVFIQEQKGRLSGDTSTPDIRRRDANSSEIRPPIASTPDTRPEATRTPLTRPGATGTPDVRPPVTSTPDARPVVTNTPDTRRPIN